MQFCCSRIPEHADEMGEANFLVVPDTLQALQALAAAHRRRFKIPVIGVAGSNGKTVVKEWLYQLLCEDYTMVRSPRSYNSQIGVPLSVWEINEQTELAVIEAGISKSGEMDKLELSCSYGGDSYQCGRSASGRILHHTGEMRGEIVAFPPFRCDYL